MAGVLLSGPSDSTESLAMTSLPLYLEDEPIGIILRAGREALKPAKIWAYVWCADAEPGEDHPHQHLPLDRHR